MKSAIITGASGFIGSWLAQELLENAYDITVIARNGERIIPEIKNRCRIVEKTIQEICAADFSGSVDAFFHLAWAGVAAEKKNELDVQLENIRGSLNVLETAGEIGCGLFLAAGTVAEYALCNNVMDMEDRQTPNDYYGAAKASSYYFMEVRARQLEQPFIWCVIPSTFGEGRTDNNIITYTIRTLLQTEKPIYGSLEQMWDFLYVQDVVKALRLLGEKGIPGKIYGIGSGEYKTLNEYICCIRDVIDPALPLGIGENKCKSKYTVSSCVNNYDLKKDTGFQPQYTFEEGIQRTVQYFRKQIK